MKKTLPVTKTVDRLALITDVVYGQVYPYPGRPINMALTMHVIKPFWADGRQRPALLWLEGGGWMSVGHAVSIPWLMGFAEAGYVVASARYRTSGESKFPAQIEDVKTAIRYLRAHADRYGIDPDRIAVMGQSAGGHLAALAGTTSGTDLFTTETWPGVSSAVSAVVAIAAPTDFLAQLDYPSELNHAGPQSAEALLLGGPLAERRELAAQANPLAYIGQGPLPPFLLIHGDQDEIVAYNQSELLYEALIRQGVEVTLVTLPGVGHTTHPEPWQPPVKAVILEFLQRHLPPS
ncbi:MAG: alpha/beta hydrolase [Firmicutes bacterium]|nr:alpha/beta hydrolase [Alicyclobacillaceae bacterium]MCL6496071.1 alpha/beta hydrolase [Bacillota bacterium]